MNNNEFLVSVIIPTRNRQTYAEATVRNILLIDDNIQIIIHDNSDSQLLEKNLISLIDGEKVIYHYLREKIAGVDNYNMAAKYATGEFFCAIGDDDTILPEIIDCAKWMKKNSIDIVLPSKALTYYWPKLEDNLKIKNAFLGIGDFSGKVEIINPENEIIELLKNGGQHYLDLKLPGSYHCLVNSSCMKEVFNRTGRYYGGLSPDMYSVVCLSLLPGIKAVYLDYPISLPGICPRSTSAESGAGKHIGRLEDAPHFVGLMDCYEWDKIVPRIYSVQTIWCETMIHALKVMDREDLINNYFSREALISYLYYENVNDRKFICDIIDDDDLCLIKKKYEKKKNCLRDRIVYLINLVLGRRYRNYNCQNINQAVTLTQKWLSKKRYVDSKRRFINSKVDWRNKNDTTC